MFFRKNHRGATLVDFLLIIIIIGAVLFILFRIDDIYQASFRQECWKGQRILDKTLGDFLMKNHLEIYQIFTAYTLYEPASPIKYKMVVILNPLIMDPFIFVRGEEAKEKLEKGPSQLILDLSDLHFEGRALCPMRVEKPDTPAIDYWYLPTDGWNCMYNGYHN